MTTAPPETFLHIEGMTCGACVARVDKALRSVPGVRDAAVNLATGMASVKGTVPVAQLVSAVDQAGYIAKSMEGSAAATLLNVNKLGEADEKLVRDRLIYGALFGIPAVAIDMMMGHQTFFAVHLLADFHDGYNILAAMLASLVMVFTGWPFFTRGWRVLRHGSANMDVLVALGAGTAYAASVISLIQWFIAKPVDVDHVHAQPAIMELHAAVTIVLLVTLGKYLESRAKRRASSAVASLATQTAATATRLLPDGGIQNIPAEQVVIGERLQVLAHQTLPVDGEVIEGAGSADLSIITGESIPLEVRPGTSLPGGATLSNGRIVLRATSTAAASTVSRILDLVNAAQASKTQIQGLADRIAAVFVPVVLVLALGNFIAWIIFSGRWEQALITTIATIVIACPCAMGLATPTAITVALGTAARFGILFTNAGALERAGEIGAVIFDKTGTLTEGMPRVGHIVGDGNADEILRLAASLEQFSEHPLAKAIVAAAKARGLALREPESFNSIAGGGVKGTFEGIGEFAIGSRPFMESLGDGALNVAIKAMEKNDETGQSAVLVVEMAKPRLLGAIWLRDTLRVDAAQTLRHLRANGIRVGVLSGDSEAAVRNALAGIELDLLRARVRPDEKAAAIAQLKAQGPASKKTQIAFVGDGVNDAPALAAADLGIAMSTGTDLAKSAGDVLLTSNRLSAIPQTLALARRTLRIIRQNLFWAFAYNVAAIPLAMAGILSPGVAAGAMILSSLTVVANALRLHRAP